MREPTWLNIECLLAIHAELLQRFGGLDGLREEDLLKTALDRPRNCFQYSEATPGLPTLAASYTEAIIGKHPFVDGNKRTGFIAAYTFLGINGLQLIATEESAAERTLALAARAIKEQEYAQWLARHCTEIHRQKK